MEPVKLESAVVVAGVSSDHDMWDPNNWPLLFAESLKPCRLYVDDYGHDFVLVDRVDFLYFSRWRWHINRPHPSRNGTKEYATRSTSNGRRAGPKLYLHVEIMKRKGVPQPTPEHKLTDHLDGNERNCQRYNLDWATHKTNWKTARRHPAQVWNEF